jgi:FkbM family methyltransferase
MGIFSIVTARWMQSGGRVFAFEPTPITRRALEDHLRLNAVEDRITIVPMAVSDLAGAATFYTVSNSQENTLAGSHSRIPTAVPITVPVTTIDEFCANNGATPALIKMDIEGFEIHALRGARETLLRYRPAVVVELHPMNWPEVGVQPEDLETLLREVGYRALALEHQRDLFGEYGHAALEP